MQINLRETQIQKSGFDLCISKTRTSTPRLEAKEAQREKILLKILKLEVIKQIHGKGFLMV